MFFRNFNCSRQTDMNLSLGSRKHKSFSPFVVLPPHKGAPTFVILYIWWYMKAINNSAHFEEILSTGWMKLTKFDNRIGCTKWVARLNDCRARDKQALNKYDRHNQSAYLYFLHPCKNVPRVFNWQFAYQANSFLAIVLRQHVELIRTYENALYFHRSLATSSRST